MKKSIIPVALLSLLLSGCTYNTDTGKHEVSILFWFFIAGISITVIILIILLCKRPKK